MSRSYTGAATEDLQRLVAQIDVEERALLNCQHKLEMSEAAVASGIEALGTMLLAYRVPRTAQQEFERA